jgi:hypothetical protein
LFNYGSANVRANEALMCRPIDAHPVVRARGNPVITVESMLPAVPILGSNYAIDYCAQLTKAEVDFHPGGVFGLPPELGLLASQQFAIAGRICAGLGCPPNDVVDHLPTHRPTRNERQKQPEVIRSRQLNCFCLDGFAVGKVDFVGSPGNQHVAGHLVGLRRIRRSLCRRRGDRRKKLEYSRKMGGGQARRTPLIVVQAAGSPSR